MINEKELAVLEALHKKTVRPGAKWQYGVSGLAGIVSYDYQDVVCAIPITTADMDNYPGPGSYGECNEADLAIAAVNALPDLIAAARELGEAKKEHARLFEEYRRQVESELAQTVGELKAENEKLRKLLNGVESYDTAIAQRDEAVQLLVKQANAMCILDGTIEFLERIKKARS
jgi:hypothetical protein